MPNYKIEQDQYKKDIQSNNYVNILNLNYLANPDTPMSDDLLQTAINTIESNNDLPAGHYLTDFFFKSDVDVAYEILQTEFKEEEKRNNESYSKSTTLDKANINLLYTGLGDSQQVKRINNSPSYLHLIFPFIVEVNNKKNYFICLLSIHELPFKIDNQFLLDGNKVKTVPRINEKIFDNYDNILEAILSALPNDIGSIKKYFTPKIYQIKDTTKTYTDFVKFLYNSNSTVFTDILPSNNTFDNLYSISIKDDNNILIKLINDSPNASININIINEDVSQKTLTNHFTDKDSKKENFKKIYAQYCLQLDNDINKYNFNKLQYQTKSGETSNRFFKNTKSDYFDIGFNCKKLKAFIISDYKNGYHVINFKPQQLYFNTQIQGEHIIDLFGVYKSLFRNKIIKLELSRLDLPPTKK